MLINLQVIPPGSEVTIKVNSDLYVRLQQCLLEGLPFKDMEDFKATLINVKDGKSSEGIAYHLHTLIFFINLIEEAAKQQGIIQDKKFDTEQKKFVDP